MIGAHGLTVAVLQDYPGLCMARTLGDQSVKDHGVCATPEAGEDISYQVPPHMSEVWMGTCTLTA